MRQGISRRENSIPWRTDGCLETLLVFYENLCYLWMLSHSFLSLCHLPSGTPPSSLIVVSFTKHVSNSSVEPSFAFWPLVHNWWRVLCSLYDLFTFSRVVIAIIVIFVFVGPDFFLLIRLPVCNLIFRDRRKKSKSQDSLAVNPRNQFPVFIFCWICIESQVVTTNGFLSSFYFFQRVFFQR